MLLVVIVVAVIVCRCMGGGGSGIVKVKCLSCLSASSYDHIEMFEFHAYIVIVKCLSCRFVSVTVIVKLLSS